MSTRQHPTNAPLFRFFIRIMVLAPSVGLTMQAAATPVSLEQADARARKI